MSMYQFSNTTIDRGQESVSFRICKSKKIRLLKENSNTECGFWMKSTYGILFIYYLVRREKNRWFGNGTGVVLGLMYRVWLGAEDAG